MLLSPGHSPRRLSSPSPSLSDTPAHQNVQSSNSLFTTTPQNPRKRASSTVLDEDTYVAAIEKIIERDFFPDIPKLRDRLDWLEATRTGDPMQIRDAQLKIIERRSGKASVTDTEGKIRTPGSTFFRNTTPLETDRTPGTDTFAKDDLLNVAREIVKEDGSADADSLTLDEFFRKYTSEDNDSFSKLIEKVNRKKRERYAFLLEGENNRETGLLEDSKKDRITDGYGTSDQPLATLETWKYTAKNLLMYHPADRGEAPLTQTELAERLKGMTKEISKTNTRFHGKLPDDSNPKHDEIISVLYNPVASGTPQMSMSDREDKLKRYDLEDLRKTPNPFYIESSKKSSNGYSYVKTPSPAPGVDSSPFITWGEIEGTPLRLEPEDTPIDIGGSGDGPHFKIPLPGSRDVKAHDLSREAARKIRDRDRMFKKPPLHNRGSMSPGLSPAAQKFVRNAIGKGKKGGGDVDESLRASYRGSSPGFSTPKGGRSVSRLSVGSRSPSVVRDGSNPPW